VRAKDFVGTGIVALLVGAGCWFFGLGVLPAIIVAFAIAGVGLVLRAPLRSGDNYDWPLPPAQKDDGERREAAELRWALSTPRGVIDDRIIDRVRTIAATSLARRQLDLDDPADRVPIERLIGPPLYGLLTATDRPQVGMKAFATILTRLEALERADPAARN
jgi:hypothetical protein